jgi:hypothetical protein
MLRPLLALALAAAEPGAPLDAAPLEGSALEQAARESPARKSARPAGTARVVQVTGARAYLDAGTEQGLAAGQELRLRRGAAEAGTCTVEAASASHASCVGKGLLPGDTVALPPFAAPAEARTVLLPAVPADDELARRAALVAVAPQPLVADQPSGPAPALAAQRRVLGEVSVANAYWGASPGGAFDVARVDAAVRGAPLGPVLVSLDVRAERWIRQYRPTFRPDDQNRFYVWQAQAGWYTAESYSVDAGRVLPSAVPGATVMDGAIVGRHEGGDAVSLFGGLVPEPDTLAPTTSRATGGAAWALDRRLGSGLVLRNEGRIAWVRSPELGDRAELEATGALHQGSVFDVYAGARLGAGGTTHAPGYLDGARVELGVRPVTRLSFTGGFDYGGLVVPDQPVIATFYPGRTRHADATAFYDLGQVRLGIDAGHSVDVISSLERTWVGPEVQLPRVFTDRVGLSAGYLEELGWLHGRSAFLQAVARPSRWLRLLGRLSFTHEESVLLDQTELGGMLSAVAELTDRVGLRVSALYRGVVDTNEASGANPTALNAQASLYANF